VPGRRGRRGLVDAAADHRLGGAVLVEHPRPSPGAQLLGKQRLAADHQGARRGGSRVRRQQGGEGVEVRGRQLDQAEAALRQRRGQPAEQVAVAILGDQHRATAREQRQEQAGDREVEAERRVDRRAAPLAERVALRRPGQVGGEAAVGDLDALRRAGRARGVEHVGEVPRRDRHPGVARALGGQGLAVLSEVHDVLRHG
jgi:hypothetical protein